MRITFDGAGDGFGQASGIAGGEVVAQLETTSAQVSHNSSRDGRGRSAVFFMLCSDGGQAVGLAVFDGAGSVHLFCHGHSSGCALVGFASLCPVTSPSPAGTEHGYRPQGEGGDCDGYAVHSEPPALIVSLSGSNGGGSKPAARISPSSR